MSRFLTLDLGTSYFKAAIFDDRGQLLHVAHEALRIEHPQPGWFELPGDSFERHVLSVLSKLKGQSDCGFEGVRAMSFATQTNTVRLLDRHGRPRSPMVIWLDTRALGVEQELRRLVADLDHPARTGIPRLGGQFTPARLLHWAHRNDCWHEVARVCLISDVLTLWFTGRHVTEAGASGLTGMVDIHTLEWIPEICEATGLPASAFAAVVRAGTDLGPVLPQVADQVGLPRDCRFVVGCLDQYAGAIGAGNVQPGYVSETTGTVLATVRCAPKFDLSPPPGVFQGPSYAAGMYYQMVFGSISANLLEAYRNALPDRPAFLSLDEQAEKVPPGAEGLRLGPDPDPTDPPSLFDRPVADLEPGRATRAILEGVAFALADQVASLCGGRAPGEIRSVGGAARSDLWRQVKADVLGCPVVATTCAEPTSLGAAILAGSAVTHTSVAEVARQWVGTRPASVPSPERQLAYQRIRYSPV